MGSYRIIFKPSVHKDLRKLPKTVIQRVLAKIEGLSSKPIPLSSVKLEGAERLYRIRVGDYRVIYQVDTMAEEIIIQYVRHRREVYRK